MGVIDDYERGERIGCGASADVFHATHLLTGRHVALKRAREDNEARARIRREIEIQRQLRHANVLPIVDWDEDARCWFTTEVAEGNLGQLQDQRKLAEHDYVRLAEEILSALGAAHRRQFFHRDLSPENILRVHGAWVLADWGFVSAGDEGSGPRRMTRTGTGGGTLTWAAPEMLTDAHRADGRADLYSLGKILAWLVSGELPAIGGQPSIAASTPWTESFTALTLAAPDEWPQTAVPWSAPTSSN